MGAHRFSNFACGSPYVSFTKNLEIKQVRNVKFTRENQN